MRVIFLLFFLLLVQEWFSQNYGIRAFSKKEGLSDPFVYTIIQDKEGYLFVATGKGLQKFDGQFFADVRSKKAEDELIYSVTITAGNQLWFGSFNGNLYYYSNEQNALKHFSQNVKGSVTKILPLINSIGFCVFSKGNGVYVTNGKFLFRIKDTENMQINAIEVLSEELILAACDDGLYTLNIKTNETLKFKNCEEEIKSIQKSEKNTYLLQSSLSGIIEVRVQSNDSVIKLRQMTSPDIIALENISSFYYVSKRSELFISTRDEKLLILNTEKGTVIKINEEEFSASVNQFYMDNESNVWIATPGKGLYRFIRTDYEYIDTENQSVYAITQDNSGNTYLGLSDGIVVKDKNGLPFEKINSLQSMETGKINSLYFDSTFLWIGTESNGLFVIDPKSKAVQTVEFNSQQNISINSITGKGKKVIVTTNLDGVYIYENLLLMNHFSVQNGLVHNNVYYALLSRKDYIFYATHNTTFNYSEGNELFEIDVKDGGLNSDFNSFAEDADGNIFIATDGDGVYVLNDRSIKTFECNEKMESMYCHGLLADKYGYLWIMQLDRLYKCHIKKKVIKKQEFTYKGNLHFNNNASYQNNHGDIFFGTDNNAIVFHSDTTMDKLPKTYLLKMIVNDSMYSIKNNLIFASGNYDMYFEISALCLKNSEAVTFSYLLEGRDKDWSEPSSQRKIKYSMLVEGNYYLKVKAYNSKGLTFKEPFVYHFTINSPYWKKPIFWLMILLAIIIAVYFIVRIRTHQLIHAKLELEQLVNEKTKLLRKEKELVQESKKLIQEQNEEIKDSITYAKRIQEALLTDKELINQHNKELFIFHQPRDIVSGDFYWMAEIAHMKIVVAADCTGHGVPGALMSMVGSTLLNKIINEKKISQPKKILEVLDSEIKLTLKQFTDTATRDGMDVCLCCIDEKKGILTYAGAMRPLYQIRNNKLIEHTPTKYAIGGFSYGENKVFNEEIIKLKKGDVFYLFSDGYADQFGGEKGKKLMLKNFKTLLLSISDLEMQSQKERLHRHYNDWKGETPQIDDVLVIGIKI